MQDELSGDKTAERGERWKLVCELFLLSFISLFLELLIIRWMSVEVRAFTVFKTFPLVTCFVGLGAGCALGKDKLFSFFPVALLWFVAWMKLPDVLHVSQVLIVPSTTVHVLGLLISDYKLQGYMLLFMVMIVALLLGPFLIMVSIGSRLGVLFDRLPPLPAYTVNVGGAILGSITFSVLSFIGFAPWQLLLPALLCFVPYIRRRDLLPIASLLLLLACIPLASWNVPFGAQVEMAQAGEQKTYWSPYQRLDALTNQVTIVKDGQPRLVDLGLQIFANKILYQVAFDWTGIAYDLNDLPPPVSAYISNAGSRYRLAFELAPGGDVLIVGAGTGNDVVGALRMGAKSVDAVDIDPVIIKLGKEKHPARPYDDPRVHIICDDARNYFNYCKKHYDLIVFSHLDSHAVTGQGASVRLDNYVYTRDSFAKVKSLLKPDGLIVLSFCAVEKWFRDRLFLTMKEALGYTPLVFRYNPMLQQTPGRNLTGFAMNTTIVAGQPVLDGRVKLPEAENEIFAIDPMTDLQPVRILTDDWPFLYVTPQDIDWPCLLVMAEILLLAVFAGRRVLFGPSNPRLWQLFFMGAAFMLLELQALVRLARLYGSSWLTAAVVINGILIMIFLANTVIMRWPSSFSRHPRLLYLLLFVTLAGSFFAPTEMLLETTADYGLLGPLLVTTVTVLPIFAAALIFATSFASVGGAGRGLAFNLFGSVLGALLEYASNYTGINSLVIIAAAAYLASYICMTKAGEQLQ